MDGLTDMSLSQSPMMTFDNQSLISPWHQVDIFVNFDLMTLRQSKAILFV